MTIELNNITSGYSTGLINDNFQSLEDYINDKLLNRDGVEVGEVNQMEVDLDMNAHFVYNLPEPVLEHQAARLQDVQNALSGGSANLITFTPYGNISSENVQGAIQEIVDGTGQAITTSTGDQTLAEALDDRANKDITYLSVDSVADLQAGDFSDRNFIILSGYYGEGTLGGGPLYLDESDSITADNGGSVFVDSAGNRWKRHVKGYVDVSEWGASPDLSDNSAVYNRIITNASEGSRVVWPKGEYAGHFESGKTLHLDFNGSTITDTSDTDIVVGFVGSESQVTTLTASASYGDRSISVSDASGLSVGDIIYISDEKERPSDNVRANFEILKIASISSNEVFVEDMIRSEQDTGTITLYKIDPVIGPSIKNLDVSLGGTHITDVISFKYCVDFEEENVSVENHIGRPIDAEFCYGGVIRSPSASSPVSTGSGEGYGVACSNSRNIKIHDPYGHSLRHTVDFASCYSCNVWNVVSEFCVASDVGMAHNTFGGNIAVDGVSSFSRTGNPCIQVVSNNGTSDVLAHVSRDMKVRSVEDSPRHDPSENNLSVYVQTSYSNLDISDVYVRSEDGGTIALSNSVIRINGNAYGSCRIENIRSPRAGAGVRVDIPAIPPSGSDGLVNIKDVHIGECINILYFNRVKHWVAGNISAFTSSGDNIATSGGSEVTPVTFLEWGFVGTVG